MPSPLPPQPTAAHDPSVASVNGGGHATGESGGSTTIEAAYNGCLGWSQYQAPNQKGPLQACVCVNGYQQDIADSGITVQAVPVNFTQASSSSSSNGLLTFTYTWGSSSGNLADLSNCNLSEQVNYPSSNNPYAWPDPPWDEYTANPTVSSVVASAGGLTDTHSTGFFIAPYTPNQFTATQYYKYACGNGIASGTLAGPISINRSVTKSGTSFIYKITKSGASASCTVAVNCYDR